MNNRVEGVYATIDEALRAVDRLRLEGYARNDIKIVANEEVRNKVHANVQENITPADEEFERAEDEEHSFWDTIKDAFTMGEPDYEEEHPINEYRSQIEEGQVVVVVDESLTDSKPEQPNTIGPDGVRDPETEQKVDSQGRHPRVDKELTTDELEDYEKRY